MCVRVHKWDFLVVEFLIWESGTFIEQKSSGVILKEEDVVVSNVRIDLTRGKSNPLERYFK